MMMDGNAIFFGALGTLLKIWLPLIAVATVVMGIGYLSFLIKASNDSKAKKERIKERRQFEKERNNFISKLDSNKVA